jgi:RHS repeat-associated protein
VLKTYLNFNGSRITDAKTYIGSIDWTTRGKIKKITRGGGGSSMDNVEYVYNASNERIIKIVKPIAPPGDDPTDQKNWIYTYYVRDAGGNILSTYKRTFEPLGDNAYDDKVELIDHNIYGSNRVGTRDGRESGTLTGTFTATISSGAFAGVNYSSTPNTGIHCTNNCLYSRELTHKAYELSNHLGSVLVTVSDKRIPYDNITTGNHTIADFYKCDVTGYSDYYAFGGKQPGRNFDAGYKFTFNGKESDAVEEPGLQDYGMREYDEKTCTFLSVDPLTASYPWYTPYQFAGNKPIWATDLDGAEENRATTRNNTWRTRLSVSINGSSGLAGAVLFIPFKTQLWGTYGGAEQSELTLYLDFYADNIFDWNVGGTHTHREFQKDKVSGGFNIEQFGHEVSYIKEETEDLSYLYGMVKTKDSEFKKVVKGGISIIEGTETKTSTGTTAEQKLKTGLGADVRAYLLGVGANATLEVQKVASPLDQMHTNDENRSHVTATANVSGASVPTTSSSTGSTIPKPKTGSNNFQWTPTSTGGGNIPTAPTYSTH